MYNVVWKIKQAIHSKSYVSRKAKTFIIWNEVSIKESVTVVCRTHRRTSED